MTQAWLAACDLDQTLIYSQRAFRLPENVPPPPTVIVEYLDGEPLSYLTAEAAAALVQLAARVPVIPVTTRTLAQYRRVTLGFTPAYAIAANGGHLLVDGVPDPGWEAAVRERLAGDAIALAEVLVLAERLAARARAAGKGWVRTIRDADGFFAYLVATERSAIPPLDAITAELAAGGWTVSVQGRKVYFVPAALTKEAALAEVMRRLGAHRLAAAGDSLLDLGMLTMADVGVRPAHGELHDRGVVRLESGSDLVVTRHPGLAGGHEVIQALSCAVTPAGDPRNSNVTFRVRSG